MGRAIIASLLLAVGCRVGVAQDLMVLRFVGEVEFNDLSVGTLAPASMGEAVVLDLVLDMPAGFASPWGPVTMFYPVDVQLTELRATVGTETQTFVPPESELGHTLLITSGVVPGGTDTDVIDLARIVLQSDVYTMRLLVSDAESSSFTSSDPSLLPPSTDAGGFEDSLDDVMIWRIDGQSNDPRVRPGTLHVRLLEIQRPIVCTGDIADDLGTLGASDGVVSFGDFLALLSLVGTCPGATPGCPGDIADDLGNPMPDGQIDFGDFLQMLIQSNEICL